MLGNTVRSTGDRAVAVVVSTMARSGMRPATCHLCEVLSAAASASALFLHMQATALALFVMHGFFDYLDGALRRKNPSLATGTPARAERSHALADKAAEVAVFLGIALGHYAAWWLAIAAMSASLAATWVGFVMLDAAGVPRSRTAFDRTDRMLVLLAFLAVTPSPILLRLVIGMACTTIIQRLTFPLARVAAIPPPDVKEP